MVLVRRFFGGLFGAFSVAVVLLSIPALLVDEWAGLDLPWWLVASALLAGLLVLWRWMSRPARKTTFWRFEGTSPPTDVGGDLRLRERPPPEPRIRYQGWGASSLVSDRGEQRHVPYSLQVAATVAGMVTGVAGVVVAIVAL